MLLEVASFLHPAVSTPAPARSALRVPPTPQNISCCDRRVVLYAAILDLPPEFLQLFLLIAVLLGLGGDDIVIDCHSALGGTKIGWSRSFALFKRKMQKLQTHIPFANIRWMAILHDGDGEDTEHGVHFAFWYLHIMGEWFRDMDDFQIAKLRSRFPGCQVEFGTTTYPALTNVGLHDDGEGKAYLAEYAWPTAVRRVLDTMSLHSLDIRVKLAVQHMFCTKIGSAADMSSGAASGRGRAYIWAICFANIRFRSTEHDWMRTEEQRLHDEHLQDSNGVMPYLSSGRGEWFFLFQEHVDKIEEDWIPKLITYGTWQRTGHDWHIRHADLARWRLRGLVRGEDIVFNILSGKFIFTGIPAGMWGATVAP